MLHCISPMPPTLLNKPPPCSSHFYRPPAGSPLVHQVGLVPHQHDDDVAAALRPHLLDPPLDVQERLPVCRWRRQAETVPLLSTGCSLGCWCSLAHQAAIAGSHLIWLPTC